MTTRTNTPELMAAAPDLLDALEGMFEAHETYSDEFNAGGKIRKVCTVKVWKIRSSARSARASSRGASRNTRRSNASAPS